MTALNNLKMGVMQGRFTDSGGFNPQQFPWGNWRNEFYIAQRYGISYIEWMFNAEMFEENPLWNKAGRKEIRNLIISTHVAINAICANYYMEYAISHKKSGFDILKRLAEASDELGIHHVIIPLFGASEIQDKKEIIELYGEICKIFSKFEVCVGFESNLPAGVQRDICNLLDNKKVGICYDVGNAAGNGYNYISDIDKIGSYLLEVHLKDKRAGGSSVMLGKGDVNFKKIYNRLKDQVQPFLIFESYFNEAEKDTARNISYIRGIMHD